MAGRGVCSSAPGASGHQREKMTMKRVALLAAALVAFGAQAATYYLQDQWVKNGENFCKYSDGTVLNMGYKVCPTSIKR